MKKNDKTSQSQIGQKKEVVILIIFCLSVILCVSCTSCSEKINIADPTIDYDLYPYGNDKNASWSSDYSQLIYYNGSHSDENGTVTDSTFGVYIKDLISDSTYIWDASMQIGSLGLTLSPDMQWLIFEAVYDIYRIPYEIPFNIAQMEKIGSETGPNLYPKWSRDGKYLALDIRLGDPGIYIMNPDGTDKHMVGQWGGRYPYFSYDNNSIYCSAFPLSSDDTEIFRIDYIENSYLQLTSFNEFEYINYVLPSKNEDILIFSAISRGDCGTYIYRYDVNSGERTKLIDKYAEAWDWNYYNDTILYTYSPSPNQGNVNGFLWTMKPDGSEKTQITFIK
ncbi:MAG: hypothetical protein K9N06_06585 [Candidatus Cloacimonetes bacterium]|nr:hypothetical protein [Candidatus Cloacimonadota bacterium]